MTAFTYPNTAATATRLLQRFGAACTLKRSGPAAYDPATGTVEPTLDTLATTAAVFAYPQKYIDGSLILQGDQQAFCVPGVEPKQGDVLSWQGIDYTVISVKPVAPAGVPVLFEAQLRGQ
jgi:hypothetical protein